MSAAKRETVELAEKTTSFERMLIDCLGCKWTMALLDHIGRGVNRPGQLVRIVDGLTTKVLNQNLTRMLKYKLLEKRVYAEIPPKVEYQLTPFGVEVYKVLLKLKALQSQYVK